MLKYPTWEEVNVPSGLVDYIRHSLVSRFLDLLIHQIVIRNRRRPVRIYTCNECGYAHIPDRSTEEISSCVECSNWEMSSVADLKFTKSVPHYSSKAIDLAIVFSSLEKNFQYYFEESSEDLIQCGWDDSMTYCQFLGGERVSTPNTRLSVLKAAVLCPYLWDFRFDWRSKKDEIIDVEHLTPIINRLISKHG